MRSEGIPSLCLEQEGDDEWSGEGGMLAFKYRVHDVRLGRFFSVDPLEADYPWNSTYAFSENRVIDGIELEGAERLNINSPTYAKLLKAAFAMPISNSAQIQAKQEEINRIAIKMKMDQDAGKNVYSVDVSPEFNKSYSVYARSEGVIFSAPKGPKEMDWVDHIYAWDKQFEDPNVGIPFMLGVMGIVASGATILEAAPAVIAGTASGADITFFVIDVLGLASNVNGVAKDKEGNSPLSIGLEQLGASPEGAKRAVTKLDLVLNVVGTGADIKAIRDVPELVGQAPGLLTRISGSSSTNGFLVKTVTLGNVLLGIKNVNDDVMDLIKQPEK